MRYVLRAITLIVPVLVLLDGCSHITDQENSGAAVQETTGELLRPGVGGSEVWVTAQDASQIKVVNGGTREVETIALPAGSGPHEVSFSPSRKYAYIANVGNGTLIIMRTSDRQIVRIVEIGQPGTGDVGTHEAKASPDGAVVLVAQIQSRTLFKIEADEHNETWTVVDQLQLPDSPICAVFREDGRRVYVSLALNGIAVVDVETMALVTVLPTDGSVQCGLVSSKHRNIVYVDSRGANLDEGNFYVLDTRNDMLTLVAEFPARDLHGFGVDPSEKQAFIAERDGDALKVLDISTPGAQPTHIALDPRAGLADRPDKVAVLGQYVYVTLRAAGKLALVDRNNGGVEYLDLVPPSANALHGVSVLR